MITKILSLLGIKTKSSKYPKCGWCYDCEECIALIDESKEAYRKMLDSGELEE